MHWDNSVIYFKGWNLLSCLPGNPLTFAFVVIKKERRLDVFNTCRTDHHLNLTRSKGGSGTLLMYYGWTVKVHLTQYSECLLGFFVFLLGLPFDIFWLVFHRSSLVHSHLQQCFQRYRAAPVSISCPGICIYWGIVCDAAWRVVLLFYGQCSTLRFRAGSFPLAHNWSVC